MQPRALWAKRDAGEATPAKYFEREEAGRNAGLFYSFKQAEAL